MTKIIFKIKTSFLSLIHKLIALLSKSCKYALKAVLYLATNSKESHKIMVKDIAKAIDVPKDYVAKLLQDLARKHLLTSARGPKGGFYMSDENLDEYVIAIVYAIDGETRLNSCILSMSECESLNPCPLHSLVNPIKQEIIKKLSSSKIKSFAENNTFKNSFL